MSLEGHRNGLHNGGTPSFAPFFFLSLSENGKVHDTAREIHATEHTNQSLHYA